MDMKTLEEMGQSVAPLNKRLVLLKDIGEEKTNTGVFIPEGGRKKFNSGVIIKCAEDCNTDISMGMRVGYQTYAGVDMSIITDGAEHSVVLLCQEDLTMILHGGAKVGVADQS